MKLLISLDIDGTITDHHSGLTSETLNFFQHLHEQGHSFAFITGRSFDWGHQVLHRLSMPYYFAIHNGAIIMEMPSHKIIAKHYLDRSLFPTLDDICKSEPSDYAIYGGYEANDECFYRPKKFGPELLEYLNGRVASFREKWHPLDSFESLPIEKFASVKCFGKKQSAERIATKITNQLKLHAPMIRDPFNKDYYVIQATHPDVNKGEVLITLKALINDCDYTVAAGDDFNDLPMLEKADVSVGMETAPQEVLSNVDIVAPAASENGIVQGLRAAIEFGLKKEKKR